MMMKVTNSLMKWRMMCPEGPTLVRPIVDWDNHPRLNHKDRYYDISPTRDFAGMKEVLRRYIISRGNYEN